MQFSNTILLTIGAALINAQSTVTVESETLVTITSCTGPEASTACPAIESSSVIVSNYSVPANVSTYEGDSNKVAVGAFALAAGALLAL
ncbi:uncharacterized protein KGF55_002042 [Candida pseudojiufengensis]|uniref:uncharacterized protein n=1 Tax=Candida pseudojiufengensis TaxID=497109 RepID=UPI00222473EB|nr:uncharacterized protein KGF55_002042 [Candida pseudojiufengensis]KAI5964100.1 hypothetical protein KGF55_002042 [Candida pseudojiufengensis]